MKMHYNIVDVLNTIKRNFASLLKSTERNLFSNVGHYKL